MKPQRPLPLSWDLLCIASIVGVWPRYLEPRRLVTTKLQLDIPLNGTKLLQISDLHFGPHVSRRLLKKVIAKCRELDPDLLVITGDFLCRSHLTQEEELFAFLKELHARHGTYAIFGNHDYQTYFTAEGTTNPVKRALKRLARKKAFPPPPDVSHLGPHPQLVKLLEQADICALENSTTQVEINGCPLNITGLGEVSHGRMKRQEAFSSYNHDAPGVILLHNPDGIPDLDDQPGDLVLSGHTHGGQVNVPIIWSRIMRLEHEEFKSGLARSATKQVYVNRGLGAIAPFRLFAPPELTLFTLGEA